MSSQSPPTQRLMNIVYGIANLANYIVGAGILGLPFVFSKTGWAVGCFLILLAAFATSLSFDFLLQASTASRCYSYDALALRTGGTRLQKFVKVLIIIDSFGPLSGYMIVIGDALQKFIFSFDGRDSPALSKTALTAYAVLVFIGSSVLRLAVVAQSPYVSAVPLCFLKTLEKLGFTSALSLVPLVYLLIFQIVHLSTNGLAPSSSYSPSVGGSDGIFVCLPIVVFAYSSQQALFPIYADLRGEPDISNTERQAIPAISEPGDSQRAHAASVVHASDTFNGHIELSEDIHQTDCVITDAAVAALPACEADASHDESSANSSLTTKSQNSGVSQDNHQSLQDMKLIVRITMVVTSLSYIICAALGYLSFSATADGNILKTYPASTSNDVLVLSMAASIILSYPVIVFPCRQSVDRLFFPQKELTYTRFVLQNIAIVAVAYGIATALPVFSTLLGIFGAVTSTFIAYILPTFFYLRTSRKSFVNDRFSWVALTVLILGGSAGMASFGFIVEGAAKNGLG